MLVRVLLVGWRGWSVAESVSISPREAQEAFPSPAPLLRPSCFGGQRSVSRADPCSSYSDPKLLGWALSA